MPEELNIMTKGAVVSPDGDPDGIAAGAVRPGRLSRHRRQLHYVLNNSLPYEYAYLKSCQAVAGSLIVIEGQQLVNFASCSYLGLEHHPALHAGVQAALAEYGTQFSASRTFVSVGIYRDLEEEYCRIFGTTNLVLAPSTTLAHLSAIPIIVDDHDLVLMDKQVHNSVQMAIDLLAKRQIPVKVIDHDDLTTLAQELKAQAASKRRVWYFGDGIYSMSGAFAPVKELQALQAAFPNFWLYLDDAHGMSWCGARGEGYVLSQLQDRRRTVVAVSHNKCFAAAGGTLVFADPEDCQLVKSLGGPLVFGGPIQPPNLGAALASAKLHGSAFLRQQQERLEQVIALTRRELAVHGVATVCDAASPIFFVTVGATADVMAIFDGLWAAGFYANPAKFPAVPMGQAGIRFSVTVHHSPQQISELAKCLAGLIRN